MWVGKEAWNGGRPKSYLFNLLDMQKKWQITARDKNHGIEREKEELLGQSKSWARKWRISSLLEQKDLETFSNRFWCINNKGMSEAQNKVNKSVSYRMSMEARILCAIREELLMMKRRAEKLERQKSDNHWRSE